MWLLCPLELGLGHKDFDGYRGRPRSNRVLWRLQGLTKDHEYGFVATKALYASELYDNMIDKALKESCDDTADEYDSDNIDDDNA